MAHTRAGASLWPLLGCIAPWGFRFASDDRGGEVPGPEEPGAADLRPSLACRKMGREVDLK